jgi:hypothetical protein
MILYSRDLSGGGLTVDVLAGAVSELAKADEGTAERLRGCIGAG